MARKRPTVQSKYGPRPAESRPNFRERGYRSGHHERWRQLVMQAANWLCERCAEQGRSTVAVIAHHRVPLKDGGTWHLENGEECCRKCHGARHREIDARKRR